MAARDDKGGTSDGGDILSTITGYLRSDQLIQIEREKDEVSIQTDSHEFRGVSQVDGSNEDLKKVANLENELIHQSELITTQQMTLTDSSSYDTLLQEAEEENDKLKKDFTSAREETDELRKKVKDLEQELTSVYLINTQKALSDSCTGSCAKYNSLISENRIADAKVSSLEKVTASSYRETIKGLELTVEQLQREKSEAVDIAAARVEIYMADFVEDRERARGALDDLHREHNLVLQEEVAVLQKQIDKMRKVCHQDRTKNAKVEARLQKELENSKIIIEKLSLEKDDWKHKAEGLKQKRNELEKLKLQLKRATESTLGLSDQLDKNKKEQKELQKAKRNAEVKVKKLEKILAKSGTKSETSRQTPDAERLYHEEQDRNESLLFEISQLNDEVSHFKSINQHLKKTLREQNVGTPVLSPEDSDVVSELDGQVRDMKEIVESIKTSDPVNSSLRELLQQLKSDTTSKIEVGQVSTEVLQREIDITLSNLQTSRKKVSVLEKENLKLCDELKLLKQEMHQMKMDFVEFGSRNIVLNQQNIRALDLIEKLRKYAVEKEQRLNESYAKVEDLNLKFEERGNVISDLLKSKEFIEGELVISDEKSKELEEENQNMRQKLSVTEANIEDLTKEMKNAEDQYIQYLMTVESERDLLLKRLKELQDDPGLMQQAFTTLKRDSVTVKEEISRGAWGIISKGVLHGNQVAIKQPHQLILHQTTIDRLKREVSCMSRVYHPNIVMFFGAVFDDHPVPMIISELMEMNLRSAYKKIHFDRGQIVAIFRDIAYALHYLHALREPIIHRDLSAPNVLLNSLSQTRGKYIAKITDFGSANLEKLSKTSGEGAFIYSAPEMFPPTDRRIPRPKQTVKVDSFSFGILLCEVINRTIPDPDKPDVAFQSVETKWKSIHSLIMRCIEAKPLNRPNMAQILNSLRNLL